MNITFIIGGSRSGKSSFALQEASKLDGQKVYIATAEALDEEMKQRIEKHKAERGSEWDTVEEPVAISSLLLELKNKYSAILLDCLTIWLSNLLIKTQNTELRTQTVEDSIAELIDTLQKQKKEQRAASDERRLVIVSNEVGMGIVPENKLARQFRDLAGTLNQKVAEIANEVYMVTAGIPVKIKAQGRST
jgi:adenosylcobinamide kinase/adenosylcobinamide-phosphate guanylyltransferase